MSKAKEKIVLVSFGLGGHTAYFESKPGSESRLEGCDSPENFMARHTEYDLEGALLVDVRAAVQTPEGHRWVFAGPLVSAALKGQDKDPFVPADEFFMEAVASAHPLNRAILSTGAVGGLDEVSPSEYARGWYEHKGIVGIVRGGEARWLPAKPPTPPVVDHAVPVLSQPDLL